MLFAHVAKPSNSRSQISLKQMFLKTRNVHRKTPVLELHFNKVSVLEGLHFFFKKQTPALLFSCEYSEIFKNVIFIEKLSIIPFRNFI